MQSKTPLLMVTALVCGLGAAFGTWKLVSSAQTGPVDEQKVQVLVPVADVAPYHMFQDDKRFTMMEWPKAKLREGEDETIKTFDQIKGKVSRHYKLKPNEPIYKNDICENMENDVQDRLRNGEVAHAIPVAAERAGGGFIKVGDRINISATAQPGNGETSQRTFFFLEDIEVLAVDNQAQKEATPMAQPPTRFLLRLTGAQSLVLKFYQDTAKLDLTKRKLGDPTKLGDSYYYTANKKPSSAGSYNEDQPEPTVTQNIEVKTLANPTEEMSSPPSVKPANKTDNILTAVDEVLERWKKHKVVINDNGVPRTQETNETYKELEKKKKEEVKKDESKTTTAPGQ